jgi:hypothetical protein
MLTWTFFSNAPISSRQACYEAGKMSTGKSNIHIMWLYGRACGISDVTRNGYCENRPPDTLSMRKFASQGAPLDRNYRKTELRTLLRFKVFMLA